MYTSNIIHPISAFIDMFKIDAVQLTRIIENCGFKRELCDDTKFIVLLGECDFPDDISIEIDYLYLYSNKLINSGKFRNIKAKKIIFAGYDILELNADIIQNTIEDAVFIGNEYTEICDISILNSAYIYDCEEIIIPYETLSETRKITTTYPVFGYYEIADLTNLKVLELIDFYEYDGRIKLILPENASLETIRIYGLTNTIFTNTRSIKTLEIFHNSDVNVEQFMQTFANLTMLKVNRNIVFEV
jgi:hypothetical protein